MLYSEHILIPANTSADSPVITYLKLSRGYIYRCWVTFPSGCAGLARLRISKGGHPFLPVNKDSYINGDNYVYEYPIMFEIEEEPAQIVIEAWNIDQTYQHTIDVEFLILPKWLIMPTGSYEGIVASMKSMFVKRW